MLKSGIVKLGGTTIQFPTTRNNIKLVRVIPKATCYVIEVVYEEVGLDAKSFNGKVAAIDLGVNNLAAVVFNTGDIPVLINGRPLKAINQFFNKKKAKLMSYVNNKGTSKSLKKLACKRNNKVKDYLHKATTVLANHIVDRDITKVIIGWNVGIKQEVNMGKKNNQSFAYIPFRQFLWQMTYKLKLRGVQVIEQEESYTSKCSFLDNEPVKKHTTYKGRRPKRGLFKSAKGITINADINAAYNIGRKAIPNAYKADGIEALPLTPVKMNILYKRA